MMANKTLPEQPATSTAKWRGKDVRVMSGLEIRDKAELVGVPFLMTAVRAKLSTRDIPYLQVAAEDEVGNTFTFQDSSTTGVKVQLEAFLEANPRDADADGWMDLSPGILAPGGLRLSEYDTVDSKGRPTKGKTHYLTTDGKRN